MDKAHTVTFRNAVIICIPHLTSDCDSQWHSQKLNCSTCQLLHCIYVHINQHYEWHTVSHTIRIQSVQLESIHCIKVLNLPKDSVGTELMHGIPRLTTCWCQWHTLLSSTAPDRWIQWWPILIMHQFNGNQQCIRTHLHPYINIEHTRSHTNTVTSSCTHARSNNPHTYAHRSVTDIYAGHVMHWHNPSIHLEYLFDSKHNWRRQWLNI